MVYLHCGIAEMLVEHYNEGQWERLPQPLGQCNAMQDPHRVIAPGQTVRETTEWHSDSDTIEPGLYRILMHIQGVGIPDTTFSPPFTVTSP